MKFIKRLLVFMLVLSCFICSVPFSASAAPAAEIKGSIDQQIRTFAKSLNKSNADDSAAAALAKHGISGGGKKLTVGNSHALTATLWNSALLQDALIDTCTAAIEYMSNLDSDYLEQVDIQCNYDKESMCYHSFVYAVQYDGWKLTDYSLLEVKPYPGKTNAYDDSLEWIAGGIDVDLEFTRKNVTADSVTYKVVCVVNDRFDFATSGNSGFKNLISGIGALFFREFNWESKVTFELTVPYSCDHSGYNYSWSYDRENHILISAESDEFVRNDAAQRDYKDFTNSTHYYHELDNMVRLRHDRPWVMEYKMRNPGYFAVTPTKSISILEPFMMNYYKNYFFFQRKEIFEDKTVFHCYGTAIHSVLPDVTYTYRFENEIDESGNNMIYLTIINEDNGKIALEKTPMDDYYENNGGVLTLKSSNSDFVSGKDFNIGYIGCKSYGLKTNEFELSIWENGKGVQSGSFINDTVTAPTCTNRGYTTHTCSLCGYSYKDSYVSKTEHNFGNWVIVTSPTCTENGTEQRSCKTCSYTETQEVQATGHFYENNVCTLCGDRIITTGDANGDGYIDARDLVRMKKFLSGSDVEFDAAGADATGDGKVNALDLVRLKKFLSGADVTLG